jgi:hypothetical protein
LSHWLYQLVAIYQLQSENTANDASSENTQASHLKENNEASLRSYTMAENRSLSLTLFKNHFKMNERT